MGGWCWSQEELNLYNLSSSLVSSLMDHSTNTDDLKEWLLIFKSYDTGSNAMDIAGLTSYTAATLLGDWLGANKHDYKDDVYDISYVYAHLDKLFDDCTSSFKKQLYHLCVDIITHCPSDERIDEHINKKFSEKDVMDNGGASFDAFKTMLKKGRDFASVESQKRLLITLMKHEAMNKPTLKHACNKGAITTMFIEHVITGDPIMKQSCYLLGAVVQLDDDLRDIKIDIKEGIRTLISEEKDATAADNYVISTLYIIMKLHDTYGHLVQLLAYGFIDSAVRCGRCSESLTKTLRQWTHVSDEVDMYHTVVDEAHNIADTLLRGIDLLKAGGDNSDGDSDDDAIDL